MAERDAVPDGYEWPGAGKNGYWLSPQADWNGATPLFMVHAGWSGGETIIAERCYAKHGRAIVDALRAFDPHADYWPPR